MQVVVILPMEMEADVDWDPKTRKLMIKPYISSEQGRGTVIYAETQTDSGKVGSRYVLYANGKNGVLNLSRKKKSIPSQFDKDNT